ncbi:hypothetical protein B0T24DRAFT_599885 [Lasiosphaeria ovina]|uniref:Uncharacterized protein n=1 Tax=Lasiosphaeria ovina TaxID=92902 RepID=A0AAE0JSS8_9PEZI|nr:hypothetical protein B0T24DRAFT_599885 [Lasiosphaeria ovina]
MSSTTKDIFTHREQELLANVMLCIKPFPTVDYTKLAALQGMTNVRSASNAWAALKKKIEDYQRRREDADELFDSPPKIKTAPRRRPDKGSAKHTKKTVFEPMALSSDSDEKSVASSSDEDKKSVIKTAPRRRPDKGSAKHTKKTVFEPMALSSDSDEKSVASSSDEDKKSVALSSDEDKKSVALSSDEDKKSVALSSDEDKKSVALSSDEDMESVASSSEEDNKSVV